MKNVLLMLLALILTACSPAPVKVSLTPNQVLNPDQRDQSLPVQVRLYQLSDPRRFQQATFWQLWQHDKSTLGNSLLAKKVITVVPGEKQTVYFARNKKSQYIGAIAVFRQPRGGDWRVLKELPSSRPVFDAHIKLTLKGDVLTLDNTW